MAEPQQETSEKEKRNPVSKGRHRPIIVIGVIILLAGIIIGAYYYWQSTFYESTDDAYVNGHTVFVSARVSGNIIRVNVRENEHVQEGDVIVEVDPCDYRIAMASAQAALQAAQADEQQAQADVEVARAELDRQQWDLARNEKLAAQGAITEQALEHSRTSTQSAKANLGSTQGHLTSLVAKTAVAKVAVEQARLQLSYTEILAPMAGYVTKKSVEVGTYVDVGQPLLAIVRPDMYVTANFKETQLTHMRLGQRATIHVDAYPNIRLKAHVDSIQAGTGAAFSLFPPENATGNFVKIVQRVPVKLVFDEPPDPNHRLVLGMSVTPKVWIKVMDDR